MVSCDAPGSCLSGHNLLSLLLEPGHDLLLHLPLHRVEEEARVLQSPVHCASQPYKASQADSVAILFGVLSRRYFCCSAIWVLVHSFFQTKGFSATAIKPRLI